MKHEQVIAASRPGTGMAPNLRRAVRGEGTPGYFDVEQKRFTHLDDVQAEQIGCPHCWAGICHQWNSPSWVRWHTDGAGRVTEMAT